MAFRDRGCRRGDGRLILEPGKTGSRRGHRELIQKGHKGGEGLGRARRCALTATGARDPQEMDPGGRELRQRHGEGGLPGRKCKVQGAWAVA